MSRPDPGYRRTQVTYGQLDRVLSSLGVSRRRAKDDPPTDLYFHPEMGPIITLAAYPDGDRVLDYHLVALRTLLDQFGIADPAVFDAELRAAG